MGCWDSAGQEGMKVGRVDGGYEADAVGAKWLFGVERGSWGESSADEEHAESVVVAVAEAEGGAAEVLEAAVDRLGRAVARARPSRRSGWW